MRRCYLCGNDQYLEILRKQSVPVWTNAPDDASNKQKYKCILCQCKQCGHVYQPFDRKLSNIVNEIYMSDHAQLSVPLGEGNWGLELAGRFLDLFFKSIGPNLKIYKSACEIGCANGYLLTALKKYGFRELLGIDPSMESSCEINGIKFLKRFADEKLSLNRKYNLIFAFNVFEHAQNIHGMLYFCKNHLDKNGEIFISVPDSTRQLKEGDPVLFVHQHIHYYTESTLEHLLSKHGFKIKTLLKGEGSLSVSAKRNDSVFTPSSKAVFFNDYQKKIERVLTACRNVLQKDRVIIHGANNALNNIVGWLGKDLKFTLVDNDKAKQGKKYFDHRVFSIDEIDLKSYQALLVIPTFYFNEIKADYIKRGFPGSIKNLIS